MRVALVGAGVMGRNIARVFVGAGHEVSLFSRRQETLNRALAALGGSVAAGSLLTEAVSGADLVIESVPERLELKQELLAAIESSVPPTTVITSNTSSLSLDALASALRRPERFLGLHWFNPAHLIPLLEVVPCARTTAPVVAWCVSLLREAGKRPRVLRSAVPGFVANRLQYALIREALQLLADGVADAETIDAAVTDCLGLRWAVIGPLRSSDLAGIETAIAVAQQLYPELSNAVEPQSPLRELAAAGRLGARAGAGFFAYENGEAAERQRDRGLERVLGALER